jgi:hypothetical protein
MSDDMGICIGNSDCDVGNRAAGRIGNGTEDGRFLGCRKQWQTQEQRSENNCTNNPISWAIYGNYEHTPRGKMHLCLQAPKDCG